MNQRDTKIDVAKGLGIILVVLGHSWIAGNNEELFRVIFSFHMPLFFLMAGFFIDIKSSLKSTITSKADALLKPCFVTLLVFGAWRAVVTFVRENNYFDLAGYFQGVAYATGNTITLTPLWFLPHLFLAITVAVILLKWLEARVNSSCITVVASFIFLTVGIFSLSLLQSPDSALYLSFVPKHSSSGLPWSFDLLGVTVAFIMLGYVFRDIIKKLSFNFPAFLISLFAFSALHVFFDETMDLNLRIYGSPFLSTAQALLGIYITISISVLIVKLGVFGKVMAYVGSGSIYILIFHGLVQWKVFNILVGITQNPFLAGFAGLFFGIAVPLAMLEVTKCSKLLSILMLPLRRGYCRVKSIA